MKISFDTAIAYVGGAPIPAASLATATYTVFIDKVNPPKASFSVPATLIAAATANADGSKHVVVDAQKDLGVTLTPGSVYFVAAEDDIDGTPSAETSVVQYLFAPAPNPPANFTVA